MRIFVTGGSGLLGNTILRQLEATDHETGYLVRGAAPPDVFAGLHSTAFPGDLHDLDCLEKATQWADVVIHSAGLIHVGWKQLEESMRVNRDGTRNIVDACLRNDCQLLHVGTVNTQAIGSQDALADETTPLENEGGQIECSYVLSKRAGNEEVLRGVERGLRAVLLHPGFMLGPWDWKPSSGRMMLEVGQTWRPITPRGGCSVCDSRDVADAIIAAIDADVPSGRSYNLAGYNETYYHLWTEIGKRFGKPRPIMPAGPLQRMAASNYGDLRAKWTGKETEVNSAAIALTSQYHWYDCSRAQTELGYRNRPLDETLDDAAAWIRERFL
ncbi:NAD-dependent epimerase/dehydratase family protein [Allorhodopirellula solitaria]|uniref:NAD-dependent epimerase/dehydratase domain-containing protein n=1 Tax=Allorhodopirellula solitaria TaxID=2527987 RepID=A0A5C5XPU9_9BACT|nr:NAD-dependent epimerase/dehydratase family protein [Allorhodopirellula solitaria]TWT64980.1 hypothetical protein CA85_33250 [Allorhodopirellula solitaria]